MGDELRVAEQRRKVVEQQLSTSNKQLKELQQENLVLQQQLSDALKHLPSAVSYAAALRGSGDAAQNWQTAKTADEPEPGTAALQDESGCSAAASCPTARQSGGR